MVPNKEPVFIIINWSLKGLKFNLSQKIEFLKKWFLLYVDQILI